MSTIGRTSSTDERTQLIRSSILVAGIGMGPCAQIPFLFNCSTLKVLYKIKIFWILLLIFASKCSVRIDFFGLLGGTSVWFVASFLEFTGEWFVGEELAVFVGKQYQRDEGIRLVSQGFMYRCWITKNAGKKIIRRK